MALQISSDFRADNYQRREEKVPIPYDIAVGLLGLETANSLKETIAVDAEPEDFTDTLADLSEDDGDQAIDPVDPPPADNDDDELSQVTMEIAGYWTLAGLDGSEFAAIERASLDRARAQAKKKKGGKVEMGAEEYIMRRLVMKGSVDPKIDAQQLTTLFTVAPTFARKLGQKVNELTDQGYVPGKLKSGMQTTG